MDNFNATAALDYLLYYDEDHDIDESKMAEWTPVEPGHMVELFERGLVAKGKVFSHKGWHHVISKYEWKEPNGTRMSEYDAQMWDGPMEVGEYCWNSRKHSTFDDEWV
jgi:hypothetical protein